MAGIGLINAIGAQPYWGGVGYIAGGGGGDPPGLASRGGAPARIRLALFLKDDMRVISIRWSEANGHYLFPLLDPDRKYFLVGFDHLYAYQAGIVDEITPKV